MREGATPWPTPQRALLVSLVYALVAGAYIRLSDHLVASLAPDTARFEVLSTFKGWGFVALTSIALFVLLWRLGLAGARAAEAEAASSRRLAQWNALFDLAPDAAFLMEEGRIVEASRTAGVLLGREPRDLVGHEVWEFSPPRQPDGSDSRVAAGAIIAAAREGEASQVPWVARRGVDGVELELEISLTALPGQPRRVLAFVRDMTDARAAAGALAQQSEQMRLLVEGTSQFFFYIQDLSGDVTYVSPSVRQITGRPAKEWLGQQHWWVTDNPLNKAAIEATHRRLRGETLVEPSLVEIRHSDGHPVMIEAHEFPRHEAGKLVGLHGIAHDVTQRKRAEAALRRSEEHFRQMEAKYRSIFENAVEGIYQVTPEGEYVTVNPMMARILGFESTDHLVAESTRVEGHFYAEPSRWRTLVELLRTTGAATGFESQMVRRDGNVIWVSENVRAVRDALGAITGFEGTAVDITEHRRRDEALRESEETARALLNAPDLAAVLLDGAGLVLAANEAALKTLGVSGEQLRGKSYFELLSPEERARAGRTVSKVVEERQGVRFVTRWRGRSYSVSIYPVLDSRGSVTRLAGFARDITEQSALEAQLRQAQKMEAIGQLAGGVAHDFNNLLQAQMSSVELLRLAGADAGRRSAAVDELESFVKRGASLTRQLLLFSRRGVTRLEHLDLGDLVREAASFLRRLVRENIQLSLELAAEPLPAYADRGQLEQALVNLAVNASDAMPDGGALTLRTVRPDAGHVGFEVEDTGPGIPAELRERVFEPFFTTKSAGKGTGLGLSVVHGIVTAHEGRIDLTSDVGQGTVFRVVLPRSVPAPPMAPAAAVADEGAIRSGRGERVLLVEDEEGARSGLTEMLTMLGYEPVAACDGGEAEALPVQPPFDVLLTDLMLPGVHGEEVARRLRLKWPDLRVILMSGYAEDEAMRHGLSAEGTHFLQKPFNLEALARELRVALEAPVS